MVDLAQTIEEWKDLQSVKVDDQVGFRAGRFIRTGGNLSINLDYYRYVKKVVG